jgi:hypothetical protein
MAHDGGLIGDIETSGLPVSRASHFREPNDVVFAQDVEPAVGVGDGAISDAPMLPEALPGRESAP